MRSLLSFVALHFLTLPLTLCVGGVGGAACAVWQIQAAEDHFTANAVGPYKVHADMLAKRSHWSLNCISLLSSRLALTQAQKEKAYVPRLSPRVPRSYAP